MALQKQNIPISFARGIETKIDDKQLAAQNLLELENAVFITPGKVTKRNGYDIFGRNIEGLLTSITKAAALSNFKDELNLFDGTKIYSYLDALDKWTEKGSVVSVITDNKSIIKNTGEQTTPDFGFNSDITVHAWEDSTGGIRYTVLDTNSETILVSNQLVSAAGSVPKVIALGTFIIIFYVDGTNLKYKKITLSSPSLLGSEIVAVNNLDLTDKNYDATQFNDRIYLAWNNSDVGNGISFRFITDTFVLSSEIKVGGEDAEKSISIFSDSSNNTWVVYADSSDLKATIYNDDLDSEILAPTTLKSIADIRNITGIEISTDKSTILYEIEQTIVSVKSNFIRQIDLTLAGATSNDNVFKRSVGLGSKLFNNSGTRYVVTAHESELQSTYFVFALDGDLIAKLADSVAGGYTKKSILPEVVQTSDGVFKFSNLRKGKLLSENNNLFTLLGVHFTSLDFVSPNDFLTSELAENLHIVGGILQSYDGASVTEQGFSVFPENVTSTIISVGSGSIADGDYQYSVVYAWIDNNGQIHRSAPSIPIDVKITGGPSDVRLTIPTLRVTKKTDAIIEIYRTEKLGTIFHKITTVDSPLENDVTVDSVTFDDTNADPISGNELLYTTGGVLDNIAPPASSLITSFKNRLALAGLEDKLLVILSKIRNEGAPVEFSDVLRIIVDPFGGDITALGNLDEKLIIFKRNAIYLQVGDGPNNLGEQSDFGEPELITTDAGCIEPNSVINTPDGLMFKSSKGIYLLDRSLQARYIGSPVEKFNDEEITSSTLVTNTNQIRFTTKDSLTLVYDYLANQWTTFTNHESVDASVYEDRYVFLKADGRVFQENIGKFTDGTEQISMKIVTSWLQFAGVQGFQRVYSARLLGSFKSKHKLRVSIGYNFNPTFIHEVIIDAGTLLDTNTYGEGSPYGDGDEIYGGKFPLYQWKIHPKIQKCEAIRLKIEDIQFDEFGEGFDLSNLSLSVGIKSSGFQVDEDRSFGTK